MNLLLSTIPPSSIIARQAGMIAEDFTFPVITTHLSLLPPLWRISSDEPQNAPKIRKIFTTFSADIPKIDASENAASEAMDVLWEDFNEEEQLHDSSSDISNYYRDHSFREEFEEVRQLKLIPPPKGRRKLELVTKMMKKLFLLHNAPKRGPNS